VVLFVFLFEPECVPDRISLVAYCEILELNKRPEISSGLASKITGFNKVAQVSPVEKKFS
jgi:hypothetical protein